MLYLGNITRIDFNDGVSSFTLPSIGRAVTESVEMLSVEGRALSGKLRRDVQTLKKKWDIQYKDIGLDVLQPLIDWVNPRIDRVLIMRIFYDAVSGLISPDYRVLLSPVAYGLRVLAPPFGGGGGMYDGISLTAAEV